jgi:hypothetical protein
MPINNDTTVTVPAISAVAEKTYNHLWLTDIHIQASTNTSGVVNIQAAPYNGDTMEVAPNGSIEMISTDNLWTAVQEVSSVAIAMQAIFDAVEPLKAWIASQEEV